MHKWPVLDTDPKWADKLENHRSAVYRRLQRKFKPLRGRNRERFQAEARQLKAAFTKEFDRLTKVHEGGIAVVPEAAGGRVAKVGRPKKTILNATAEGIGLTLAKLANRFEAWRSQRDELAEEIRHVVGAGQNMLAELGHDAASAAASGRRRAQRIANSTPKTGRREGFTMSAAARAKISAAQKARWAKAKSE